jgi:hypothetical protein
MKSHQRNWVLRTLLGSVLLFLPGCLWAQAGTWTNAGAADFTAGFFSAYSALTFDASGTLYLAYVGAGNKASVMKFTEANGWVQVGAVGFSNGPASSVSLTLSASGTPYIAYPDSATDGKVSVMRFSGGPGTGWDYVGLPHFSADQSGMTANLALNGETPYVAYAHASGLNNVKVMRFDGTGWVPVGTAGTLMGTAVGTGDVSLALNASGTPYIAYMELENERRLSVKAFDGTNWNYVGAPTSLGKPTGLAPLVMDASGTPYAAYADKDNADKATVMKLDGASWVAVGTPEISEGRAYVISLALDAAGAPYIAYVNADGSVSVKRFEGTDWVAVGTPIFSTPLSTPVGSLANVPLAVDPSGTPYIAYVKDFVDYKISVMRFVRQNPPPPSATTPVPMLSPGLLVMAAMLLLGAAIPGVRKRASRYQKP